MPFPYGFVRRKGGKKTLAGDDFPFHNKLLSSRADLAFDIDWTTETPTALTPCEDPDVDAFVVPYADGGGENGGYNKRWLIVDGKLAISPFTVKGVIEAEFANLLGGCIRVPEREIRHDKSMSAGTFPYPGAWKRYRVSMNRKSLKSLPGIIEAINPETGYIKIRPVEEYFCDFDPLPSFVEKNKKYRAIWEHPKIGRRKGDGSTEIKPDVHKRRIISGSLRKLNGCKPANAAKKEVDVAWFGEYKFGMNGELGFPSLSKTHRHRFYAEKNPACKTIEGVLPEICFAPNVDGAKGLVYVGNFCKGDATEMKIGDPRTAKLGEPWFDDLRQLNVNSFCYYTTFKDETGEEYVAGIGKNFQFKTPFLHEKTVPSENAACRDITKLCPKCLMFGSTREERDEDEANPLPVGYAGRFRAAALTTSFRIVKTDPARGSIPRATRRGQGNRATFAITSNVQVDLSRWVKEGNASGEVIIRQVVLPPLGTPKPSKRDVDGYFDREKGLVKGSKRFPHTRLTMVDLDGLVARTDGNTSVGNDVPYSHEMRPVAPVCPENIVFHGTVGAENCDPLEVAALLLLLDHRLANHAFKIGLGKSLGMGSVSSRIRKIWVRRPGCYWWKPIDVPATDDQKSIFELIGRALPDCIESVRTLKGVGEAVNRMIHLRTGNEEAPVEFPVPGQHYWTGDKPRIWE